MQFKTILAATATVAVASAQSIPSLASALNSTADLSTLNTLLQAHPQVLQTLANSSNITVFAPNNAALAPLSTSPLLNDSAFVSSLLTYHAYKTAIYSQNITTTPVFPHSLLNNSAYSNVTGGQVVKAQLVNNNVTLTSGLGQKANVVQANIQVSNGTVVHIIDNYLTIPENISATAEAAGLTALAGALNATNLTTTLDNLHGVTVFAPTNAAFASIGSALTTLNASQATSILEYHVVNGTAAYSNLISNATVKSLEGANLTLTVVNGQVFVNQARVIAADILVSGGVIHLIDSVLNPANATAAANTAESSGVVAFSGASSGAVPYTSGAPTQTTTYSGLTQTTNAVAQSYSPASSGALAAASSSQSAAARSSSSSAGAPVQTAALGAAALFGAAAFFVDI